MKNLPDDSIVRLIDLPPGIGGAVMEDEEGFINIYINARHGHNAQIVDLEHEIVHVENNDLHSSEDILTIETRADGRSVIHKTIPELKARDLIPKQPPKAKPKPEPLNRHQIAILSRCISELDSCFYGDFEFFGTHAGNRII